MKLTCAHCGKRVLRANGFFRSFPVPLALHHECMRPYLKRPAAERITRPEECPSC